MQSDTDSAFQEHVLENDEYKIEIIIGPFSGKPQAKLCCGNGEPIFEFIEDNKWLHAAVIAATAYFKSKEGK